MASGIGTNVASALITLLVVGWLLGRRAPEPVVAGPEEEPTAPSVPAFGAYRAYLRGDLDYQQYLDQFAVSVGSLPLAQARPQSGMAFPEVRSWTRIGPNPALPGVLIRVNQPSDGPGHREPMV